MSNRIDRSPAFVGRETELHLLRQRLISARAGSGQLVFVHGEAGIGKTSLARTFASEAGYEGACVCWGRGYEGDWSPPYTPWVEALTAIGKGDADRFDAFPAVADSGSDLSADEARFRLHDRIWRHLEQRAEREPLLIVLDDLQWVDAGSLELLRHIVHFGLNAPVVILSTYRDSDLEPDHPLSQALPRLHRADRTTFVHLGGFDTSEISQLFEALGANTIKREIVDTVQRATDGNPLFVSELIQNWEEEQGGVGRGEDDLALGVVPAGIRRVVEYRLARLSPAARTVLNHVSVFSSGFDFSVLPHLTEMAETDLLDAIDELLAARLIEPVLQKGGERYDFVHSLFRAALIEPLSPSRRVRLERSAAIAMERAYGEGAEVYAEELAIQFGRSASLAGAESGLRYALIATDRARRGFDRERAVFFLRLARDLVTRSFADVRAMVLTELAVAEADAVVIEAACATAEQAIEALRASGAPPDAIAQFLADLVTALKQHASAPPGIWRPLLDAGLAATARHDLQWARLMLLIDPVQPVSRDVVRVGRWIGFDAEALAIARGSGDERALARTVESFDFRDRRQTAEHLALVRTWTDPLAIMFGLTVVANDLQYRHGAFDDAELVWEELIGLAERQGAINWQAQATNQLTILHIARGRFEAARETEERANALLERLGAGRRSGMLALEMETAFALELGGDWGRLARQWRTVVADPTLGPNDPATLMTAYYAALAVCCSAQADDRDETAGLIEILTPLLEALTPFDTNQNGAVALVAEAVWNLESRELAPRYLALATALRENAIGDYPQTSLALTVARMAALSDQPAMARANFVEARNELSASRQRPLRAKVDFDEALFLLRIQPDAEQAEIERLIASASDTFDRLGMAQWAERVARLRETIANRVADQSDLPGGLSERELEVLRLVARGLPDRQISDQLFISPRTVHSHIRNMLNKTGTNNRTDLSIWWFKQHLADEGDGE